MKILVTGSDGYLAGPLLQSLLGLGHHVVGLDTRYFAEGTLYQNWCNSPFTIVKDIRRVVAQDLSELDGIVHMAELSNDPLGEMAPKVTCDINYHGSMRLAELARQSGVPRFVYMSSCSVYGVTADEVLDESSAVNPQTTYAACKRDVERDLGRLANDAFSPTFLRNATAFGASPRMRFDIVLNNLAGQAWTKRVIGLSSDGSPWRPLVHALDIAQAIIQVLQAPREAVHNQVFNVGSTRQNYSVRQIAEIVAEVFPGCALHLGPPNPAIRGYRVSFEKIHRHLPGFQCQWDARRGAEELRDLFTRIDMQPEVFQHRAFTRVKALEHLLHTRQINREFFWNM